MGVCGALLCQLQDTREKLEALSDGRRGGTREGSQQNKVQQGYRGEVRREGEVEGKEVRIEGGREGDDRERLGTRKEEGGRR